MFRILSLIPLWLFCNILPGNNEITDFFKSSKRNDRFNAGAIVISSFLLPFYSTEQGFYFSAGILTSFKPKRNNPYLSHSILPLKADLGINKTIMSSLLLNSYCLDDIIRFNLLFIYNNLNDHYWGVGMDRSLNVEKGSLTTAYRRKYFAIQPELAVQVIKNIYAGIIYDYIHTVATDITDLMKEDEYIIKFGTDIRSTGLGALFKFDSRSSFSSPAKGLFIKLNYKIYREIFGSKYEFEIVQFDYRQDQP
ncbi:MAG: hypothetical protein JW894_12315 [Bacteroidales bacterium]|nr:hypothetical protein [Bacteroidales bacterium]